ncbi:MAG: preprotein translocase subunit SecG [Peptococcaceae bacterium BRH_c4a]|nr:MAG: preprotein translocase subunit SecG [Peptococcaceae bacterium BRH_c4a]
MVEGVKYVLKGLVTALHVIMSIAVIAVVLLQSGKSAGLSGSIAGGAETFFGKKKGLDELLGKVTIVVGILFAVTSLVLGLQFFGK